MIADDERAMIELGVGKNMVRAIRFWVQVAGVATSRDGALGPTDFGKAIFSDNGFDPFLEDVRTLWLIHWTIATQKDEPLFAWDFLLNRWQSPEIERTDVLRAFQREAERLERPLSAVTLEQHFETFSGGAHTRPSWPTGSAASTAAAGSTGLRAAAPGRGTVAAGAGPGHHVAGQRD